MLLIYPGKVEMSIKILLADEHKILRDGLRSLFENQGDMEIVAEAESGRQAVQLARQTRPDVVIMEIIMPDANGMEITQQIIAALPQTKVIALSTHADRHFLTGMLGAGASGVLVKACAFEELVKAVRAVVANRLYLASAVAGLAEEYEHGLPPRPFETSTPLTPRELQVLTLIAEGWSTTKIASHLEVSVKTVQAHRQRIMDKLGLYSVADLTKYAIRKGLIVLKLGGPFSR